MFCSPENIINQAKGYEVIVHPNGDTADIIAAIMAADKKADSYINKDAVSCLVGRNNMQTLENVWRFVKSNVTYRTDRPGLEKVKSPGALFHQVGKGDCKSFSISIAAILRALGFSGIHYRFVGFKNRPGEYTHVYVVVKNGSNEVILDSTIGRFNYEVPYKIKKDIAATGSRSLAAVSGVPAGRVNGDIQNIMNISLIGIAFFLIYKLAQ